MSGLAVHVSGVPVPQGSKRGFVNRNTGRVVLVEANKKTMPWRERVTTAAEAARWHHQQETYLGPVELTILFLFPHPKSHYRTGRNAALLRDNAPRHVATKPDLDKLQRSCCDALGDAGVWRDDSQVVAIKAAKRYAEPDELPGATIYVQPLDQPTVRRVETPVTQGALL